MKKVFAVILLIPVLFPACTSKTTENQDQTEATETVVLAEDNANAAFKNLITLVDKKGVTIPIEYNDAIVGDLDLNKQSEFVSLMESQKSGSGNSLLAFGRAWGCTPSSCQFQIIFLELNEDKIVNRGYTTLDSYQTEDKTRVSLLHEIFLFAETKSQYVDSEPDVNAPEQEPAPVVTETKCLAVFNGKIAEFPGFSKPDLLLLRNHIFARHGHQFKLDSLREYFSKFDWYKPVSSNVSDKLTEDDKKLVEMLLKEEAAKN